MMIQRISSPITQYQLPQRAEETILSVWQLGYGIYTFRKLILECWNKGSYYNNQWNSIIKNWISVLVHYALNTIWCWRHEHQRKKNFWSNAIVDIHKSDYLVRKAMLKWKSGLFQDHQDPRVTGGCNAGVSIIIFIVNQALTTVLHNTCVNYAEMIYLQQLLEIQLSLQQNTKGSFMDIINM